MSGSLLMFLQGGVFLHTILAEGDAVQKQATVPVSEAVDSFLFGIVLVIFAYGIAIGFVFALPKEYGERLPTWMKVGGVATLAEVVIVVLIVIFARIIVEANGQLQWSMLVLPASILLIAPDDRARRREASKRKHGGGRRALAVLMTE